MKGLLKNNFYGVIENLKIALAFVMLVGVLLLITGEATLLSAFSLIAPPIIALLMVSCVRKESASKWEKYKLTLPVRRKAIIESQYISHTIWSISGVVIVAVFMTLTVFIHGDQYFYYGFRDAITLVLGGGILAILIGAFSYPLYYLWGAEKTEVILIISVIGSIGIVFALTMLVNTFSDGNVSDTLYYISVADGLFCREIDGLFCRSSPDIIVRRRCVLSHKRRGWLQPSPSFRYSRNLALQDELYHPVINNGPAVLVCVDKRLGTGPVNQSRDAG